MVTIGKINPYDDGLEDWDSYVEKVDQYFTVNEISNEKKVSAILSLIGPKKTYASLKSFYTPAKPGEQSYNDIIKKNLRSLEPKTIRNCRTFYIS